MRSRGLAPSAWSQRWAASQGVIAVAVAAGLVRCGNLSAFGVVQGGMTGRSWLVGGLVVLVAAALAGCGASSGGAAGSSMAKVSAASSSSPAASPTSTPQRRLAPLADPAATPKGWSPVELGAIEVSVPSRWLLEYPGLSCATNPQGQVFLQQHSTTPAGSKCTAADLVTIGSTPQQPLGHPHHLVVDGVPVTRGQLDTGEGTVLAERALGMQVDARGPHASRVLATLTHSPRSVVLHSTVSSAPPGWQKLTFGGLRFAVPGSWTLTHEPGWPGCPSNIEPDVVLVQRADSAAAGSCGGTFPSTAGDYAGRPGLVVAAGPGVTAAPPGATCLQRNTLRICVDPPPAGGGQAPGHEPGLLTAQVTVPGQSHLDQVEIGLHGTGLQALEIFDSITPAAPTSGGSSTQ